MQKLKPLNSKEKKSIYALLEAQWGFCRTLPYIFFESEKSRIYLACEDIAGVDFSLLRVNSVGLYFGELVPEGIRLSIEGSQIIGPEAKKNIVDISREELLCWLRGEDLQKDGEGFVLIRRQADFCGCGKAKAGKILNYVPKTRRIGS